MSPSTFKIADALCAKKSPISCSAAVMTRLGGERGLVGPLQRLQRGSDPCGTTHIPR